MEFASKRPKYLALGTWGAPGANLTVQPDSVSIDLPCANANFIGRPKLNSKGEFDAKGRYNQEGPGAVAIEPPSPKPLPGNDSIHNARFHGKVTGKKLEFTITLTESGEKLGPYSLVQGKSGRVFKCM